MKSQNAYHFFQIAVTMASNYLLVLTLLLGFLLINSIKAVAEYIEFTEFAGYGEKKLSNVVVVGNVFCDTCFKHQFSKESTHVIAGTFNCSF